MFAMNKLTAFTKYHGNGNDFIIFDLVNDADEGLYRTITHEAKALCDRHRGIGGDGVITVHNDDGQWRIAVVNADGSIAQNCGNGLRVAARHIITAHGAKGTVAINFAGANYLCSEVDGDIAVAMGVCTIRSAEELLSLPDAQSFARGHIGNDHLVFLVEDGEKGIMRLLAYVQDKLPGAHDFNLGFLWRDVAGKWCSRVFERGVGFTEGCGTGAIVAASFLHARSRVLSPKMDIFQPGGRLTITLTPHEVGDDFASFSIVQQGKADEVFTGICVLTKS
jgi:diaminopimelate epimerase